MTRYAIILLLFSLSACSGKQSIMPLGQNDSTSTEEDFTPH